MCDFVYRCQIGCASIILEIPLVNLHENKSDSESQERLDYMVASNSRVFSSIASEENATAMQGAKHELVGEPPPSYALANKGEAADPPRCSRDQRPGPNGPIETERAPKSLRIPR